MRKSIAVKSFEWLKRENGDFKEDLAVYRYAVKCTILGLTPIGITLALGVLFKKSQEGFAMIITYMLIRKFSGGYHLKRFTQCFVASCCAIALGYVVISTIEMYPVKIYFNMLVVFAAVFVIASSPIEDHNRTITDTERKAFKFAAGALIALSVAVYCIFSFLGNNCAIGVGVGIILVFGLQVPCIVRSLFNNHIVHFLKAVNGKIPETWNIQ